MSDIVTSRPIVVLPKRKMLGTDTTRPEPLNPQTSFDKLIIGEAVITEAMIQDLAVTNAKINDLNAVKITAGYISVDRLEAGTISATKLSFSAFDKGLDDLDDVSNGTTYGRIKLASLDANGLVLLDQVVEGTYGKVLTTDISSGHIKLSSTVKDGEWYDESGVEINANSGINIYGTGNALTTRATKTGTIQCYVGSDGKFYAGAGAVFLDLSGFTVKEGNIFFQKSDGTDKGWMGYYTTSDALVISGAIGAQNTDIWISPGTGKVTKIDRIRTTPSNKTASRVIGNPGTTYQNTAGKPIFLHIVAGSLGNGITLQSASSSPPSGDDVSYLKVASGEVAELTAIIPINWYYRCNSTGATLVSWHETELG